MTNEELLQQAKDQVAGNCLNDDAFPCSTWDEVMSSSCISKRYVDELNKDAALLAIQSAREEAVKQFRKELVDHFGKLQEQAPTFKDATYLAGVRTVIDCHGKSDTQILNELPKDDN